MKQVLAFLLLILFNSLPFRAHTCIIKELTLHSLTKEFKVNELNLNNNFQKMI